MKRQQLLMAQSGPRGVRRTGGVARIPMGPGRAGVLWPGVCHSWPGWAAPPVFLKGMTLAAIATHSQKEHVKVT